jgi:Meiotically up-regulated gene 113
MRDQIVSKIREIAAANGGTAPGQKTFQNETGISRSAWLGKHWAKWSDAVRDAGLAPQERNRAIPKETIFKGLVEIVRHFGREPSRAEFDLYRNHKIESNLPWYQTLIEIFGSKAAMFGQFNNWLASQDGYNDVKTILPPIVQTTSPASAAKNDGFVYLLRSGGNFKVGRGENLERRVKQIQTAMPDKTELIHAIRTDDPAGIEAYWHRRFDEKRANGEWFKLNSTDVAAFKKRKFQ